MKKREWELVLGFLQSPECAEVQAHWNGREVTMYDDNKVEYKLFPNRHDLAYAKLLVAQIKEHNENKKLAKN